MKREDGNKQGLRVVDWITDFQLLSNSNPPQLTSLTVLIKRKNEMVVLNVGLKIKTVSILFYTCLLTLENKTCLCLVFGISRYSILPITGSTISTGVIATLAAGCSCDCRDVHAPVSL